MDSGAGVSAAGAGAAFDLAPAAGAFAGVGAAVDGATSVRDAASREIASAAGITIVLTDSR